MLMMIVIIPATNIHLKQVSPMKNGNRLVISLADYKMDDGRYTCQVLIRHAALSYCRLLFGFVTKRSTVSTTDNQLLITKHQKLIFLQFINKIFFQLSAQKNIELEHTVRVRGKLIFCVLIRSFPLPPECDFFAINLKDFLLLYSLSLPFHLSPAVSSGG